MRRYPRTAVMLLSFSKNMGFCGRLEEDERAELVFPHLGLNPTVLFTTRGHHKNSTARELNPARVHQQQLFALVSVGKPPMGVVPCMAADVKSIIDTDSGEHIHP